MTRVYVEATGRRIAPFDDPMDEVPIAGRPLAWWRAQALQEAGLVLVDRPDPPCLVMPDTLLTTGHVLRALVEGAAGRDAVLVLARSVFGERTAWLQDDVAPCAEGWRFRAVRFVSGAGAAPVDVVVDPMEQVLSLPLPPALMGDRPMPLSLPTHPVITLHHWAHILWATQAMGASEVRRVPRWRGLLRLLWAVVRARSLNRWRVLARLNTVGRGCDIHPTAVVEGSTLGSGVTVGPYARVLFSRLGDGATVMPGAHVEVSTLGEGAVVAQGCGVRLCVLYPEAFCGSHMTQAAVLGRRTFTALGTYLIDLNLERNIRVPKDGALQDTGTRFLGCAIGHRSRVGTGVWVASGRALPNDTQLVRSPAAVIARTDVPPGGTWQVSEGRLAPVGPQGPAAAALPDTDRDGGQGAGPT